MAEVILDADSNAFAIIDSDRIRLISYDSDDSDNATLLIKNLTINTVSALIAVDSQQAGSFANSTVSAPQVAYGAPAAKENWS